MGAVYGILGQDSPAAATLVVAYAVPVNKHAAVRVVATNRSGSPDKFRIAVSSGAPGSQHYLVYDKEIGGNDALTSVEIKVGSRDLGDRDRIRVRSRDGNTTFTVTGIEEDN